MRINAALSILCLTLACGGDEDPQRATDAGTEQDGRDGQDQDGQDQDGDSADGASSDGESADGRPGDGEGEMGEACEALTIERCREDNRCSVTELKPWNEDGGCWSDAEPAGCLTTEGAGCTSEVSCWLDPDGKRWLKGGCPPAGWTVTPCDGYAACE